MIITSQKDIKALLNYIKEDKSVFLAGCAQCATSCKTGGEKELEAFQRILEKEGKTVTGRYVIDPACSITAVKRFNRENAEQIEKSDVILSFTCGCGTQTIVEVLPDKKVISGNDTLFMGEITKLTLQKGVFDQKCSMCGDCMLNETAGVCPITRCPKGLNNGPCGGSKNRKCEVNKDMDCVWLTIYDRLKKSDRLDILKKIRDPKDHSKSAKPRHLEI